MTSIQPADQFTHMNLNTLLKKIYQFPLVRIIIVIAFILPARFVREQMWNWEIPVTLKHLIIAIIGIALYIFFYSLYTKIVERRKATEFSTGGMIHETLYGLGVGSGIMVLLVFIMFVSGFYIVKGFNSEVTTYINFIFIYTILAFEEELIFRLILFRLVEESLGTWVSILFQIFLFGFVHAFNPNATFWSSLAIGVEAGILLSAVYIYTRRMWFALALHMAWNYTQGVIFGINVSGFSATGIIEPVISGPDILTGGSFGLEASMISIVICLFISACFIQLSVIEKKIVRPAWKRKSVV